MANKRIIELNERSTLNMSDYFIVDDSTGTRKLAMATLFDYMTYSSMVFVSELPTTDISENTIYLLPHSGSTTQWDEYIYRDNEWNVIGTSTIDLSAIYQTKTDNNLQTTSKQIVGAINEVNSELDKGTVSVTADGSKTYAQLFTQLAGLIDYSKLREKSKLIIDSSIHDIALISGNIADFSKISYGGRIYSIRISAAEVDYTSIVFSGAGTSYNYVDVKSNTPDNSTVIKVVY